ncbi:MAG: hypothetical protein WBW85_21875, partial [Terriglobales bacterium]
MKSRCFVVLAASLLALTLSASAREMVLPAGTLLRCTMNEPNFSSATVAVGDPVLCHLHSVTEFGQQTFPRGSYLVGHLESAQDPGHFWGKGYMKLVFDRIGLPNGDMPLDAKVIATRGYKVDKDGDIRGKGHARRDVVEWMLPPLWPWKIIMLPARGPRPTLKGESMLELRLMDDVELPQVAEANGPDWHFFGGPAPTSSPTSDPYYHGSSYHYSYQSSDANAVPQLTVRDARVVADVQPVAEEIPPAAYANISRDAIGGGAATSAGVPIFVLKTGMVLAVGNYTYQDGRISYELASGGSGVISTDEVDWNTTTRVNAQRGVRVTLRPGYQGTGTT